MAKAQRLPKLYKQLAYWVKDDALQPLFPVRSFSPDSACPHGTLPSGTQLCCMVCHKSGVDGRWKKLARSVLTDPKPEAKPEAAKPKKLTRKEYRQLKAVYGNDPEWDGWFAAHEPKSRQAANA